MAILDQCSTPYTLYPTLIRPLLIIDVSILDIGIRTEDDQPAAIYGDRTIIIHAPSLVELEVKLYLGSPRQGPGHQDRTPVPGDIHLLCGRYVRGKILLRRRLAGYKGHRYLEAEA